MSTLYDSERFGPLASLMNDPEVTDVMVDGPSLVYVYRKGRMQDTDIRFADGEQLMSVIRQIVGLVGRSLNDGSLLDFRLADSTRVNIVLPPVALNGPALTIRKYIENKMTIEDLIRFGSLSAEVAQFLRACVQAKLNIIVSGGTLSGKTTLFNVLLYFIPDEERIVVLEREAMLQLRQKRVVRLETRPPDRDGKGEVTMRDLVVNSLNMFPDRIVVGELKGDEVLELIQAMNAGQDGIMSLVHANNPRDALARLETMATLNDFSVPILTVRKLMASTIDLIVQLNRLHDGSRKIVNVSEVREMQGDLPSLADIFVFEQQGLENGKIVGRIKPTGLKPTFLERLKATGVALPANLFG